MVRYKFINRKVLEIYKNMEYISYPIDVIGIIKQYPNCRFMSYQQLSKLNNCSVSDIVQLCESKSGCTHYDTATGHYLILCNQSTSGNNNHGRQRWTSAHEFGHVVCNHHSIFSYEKLAENNFLNNYDSDFEKEADYFASILLAPFPFFKPLNIHTSHDIQSCFGLSAEAASYKLSAYNKWKTTHIKTSWENDMLHLFNDKYVYSNSKISNPSRP